MVLIKTMNVNTYWGWKDPRTSLTLPFWRKLIPGLKVLNCLRNPLEVSQSLAYRNGFPYTVTMDLWKTYYDTILSDPSPENQLITHYNSYFIDPQTELQRLLDFIEIPVDVHIIKKACETMMPTHRHNRSTIENLIDAGTSLDVASLYAKMCMQAGPVYWNAGRNKLQENLSFNNQEEYLTENGLLLGLVGKIRWSEFVAGISEKEKIGQFLNAQIKEKELEISTLAAELKTLRDLTATMPTGALKVFALVWMVITILIPHNSRRERFASYIVQGLVKLYRRNGKGNIKQYQTWISRFDDVSEQKKSIILKRIESLEHRPLLSILMPVYNPPIDYLDKAIKSVRNQIYPHWEFCIADDASPNSIVRDLIEKHAREDARIRYVFRKKNGHISEFSNSALDLATGEFTALLDHDDVLHPLALYYVAEEINEYPDVEVIYSDEDLLNEWGSRISPYFKPDFDYDFILSQNMVSHLGVYRTHTMRDVGGFRINYEGSQDYDLVLRIIERIEPRQIRHIPRVLYHWRVSNQSAASGAEAKPYAHDAGLRALKGYLTRKRIEATVEFAPGSYSYRVKYVTPQPHPSVEIIICTRDFSKRLEQCVNSILLNTRYANYGISIYLNSDLDVRDRVMFKQWLRDDRVSVIHNTSEANQSKLINQAVIDSKVDYICLLDEKTDGFSADWLEHIMGHASQAGIGAIGPLLLHPNNKIFSSGIVLKPNGEKVDLFSGLPKHSSYRGWATLQKGFSAISDNCLVVRRSHFLKVGGFNEEILSCRHAVIDFCLKLREAGLHNVITPIVELYVHQDADHAKAMSNRHLKYEKDESYIKDRWHAWIAHDPAFNPNLDFKRGKIVLVNPRRGKNKWD